MDSLAIRNALASIMQQPEWDIEKFLDTLQSLLPEEKYNCQLVINDELMKDKKHRRHWMIHFLTYVDRDAAWKYFSWTAKQAQSDWKSMRAKVTAQQKIRNISDAVKQTIINKWGTWFENLVKLLLKNAARKLKTLVFKFFESIAKQKLNSVVYQWLLKRGPGYYVKANPEP